MYEGQLVFSQLTDHLPFHVFRKCVRRYGGNRYVKSFPCLSQFLCMAFAQLTHRESLRDIEIGLRARTSSTTWASAARCRATRWRTPTDKGTGASTRSSRRN